MPSHYNNPNGVLSGMPTGILDPRYAALLQTGLGLMAGSGPSRTPQSFGSIFGQAGQQGLQAFQNQSQANLQQQLFELQKKKLEKEENPFAKINPKDYTPESISVFARTKNQSDLVPIRQMSVGPAGQVYDPTKVQPGTVLPDPNKPFNVGPEGFVPNIPFQEFELSKRKAGATNVTQVNAAEDPFMKSVGKGLGESFVKRREDAMSAVSSLRNLSEGKRLVDSGIITGAGAELIVKGGQVLKTLGIPIGTTAEETIANTQAFAANTGREVGQIIKAFGAGTGLSDADREYAEKIAGGRISLDEGAIRRLMDINERIAKARINEYNKEAEEFLKTPQGKMLPKSQVLVTVPESTAQPAPRLRRYNPKTGRIE
jgi:hypothetical protein